MDTEQRDVTHDIDCPITRKSRKWSMKAMCGKFPVTLLLRNCKQIFFLSCTTNLKNELKTSTIIKMNYEISDFYLTVFKYWYSSAQIFKHSTELSTICVMCYDVLSYVLYTAQWYTGLFRTMLSVTQ